jgi:hypothetical protein
MSSCPTVSAPKKNSAIGNGLLFFYFVVVLSSLEELVSRLTQRIRLKYDLQNYKNVIHIK